MGATTFTVTKTGNYSSAAEAFNKAIKDAQYEHGHGGYTGTIAEKRSFRMAKFNGELTKENINTIIQNGLAGNGDFNDKYGPAGCIELVVNKKDIRSFLFFGWASE